MRPDAGGGRGLAGEHGPARQGQRRRCRRRCASRSRPAPAGLKVHEDWGSTPAAHRLALRGRRRVRRAGRDPHRHAQRGRVRRGHDRRDRRPDDPHVPHRGCGRRPRAGHHHASPAQPNVLPSSTNPTRPYTVNTLDEHARHADGVPPPQPTTCPRTSPSPTRGIRAETIAAEDVLHDLGVISMLSSDSQAMGRIGETFTRAVPDGAPDARPSAASCPRTPRSTTTSGCCATSPS